MEIIPTTIILSGKRAKEIFDRVTEECHDLALCYEVEVMKIFMILSDEDLGTIEVTHYLFEKEEILWSDKPEHQVHCAVQGLEEIANILWQECLKHNLHQWDESLPYSAIHALPNGDIVLQHTDVHDPSCH